MVHTCAYRLASVVSLVPLVWVHPDQDFFVLAIFIHLTVLLDCFLLEQRVLSNRAADVFQIFWREVTLRLKSKAFAVLLLNYNEIWLDFEILG